MLSDQKNFKLAMQLSDQRRFIEARDLLLSINENYRSCFDFNFYLGAVYFHLSEWTEAINFLKLAVFYKNDSSLAYHFLGQSYTEQKNFDQALVFLQKAFRLDNINPDIQNDLGYALHKQGKYFDAISYFNSAITLDPSFKDAFNNKGISLCSLNLYEDAKKVFQKAIDIDASFFVSYTNLALALQMLGEFGKAKECLDKALNLNPFDSFSKWNLANLLLLLDRYDEAWPLYELRWKTVLVDRLRNFREPLWLGNNSIKNKTIFIYAEQGFGDLIQFARYIPLLKSLNAKVIFEAPQALHKLMSTIDNIEIVDRNDKNKKFDFHCPLMTLPYAFKTNISNIPNHNYLNNFSPDEYFIAQEKNHCNNSKLNIGICWAGSNTLLENFKRSISLQMISSIFELPVNFHAIQKDITLEDKVLLNKFGIKFYDDKIKDFKDTASLIHFMDLVISIDTSVAHLSATLNKSTWIMIPFVPDWRWGINRTSCPWYPTAKLYRQTIPNSWVEPINHIKNDLTERISLAKK